MHRPADPGWPSPPGRSPPAFRPPPPESAAAARPGRHCAAETPGAPGRLQRQRPPPSGPEPPGQSRPAAWPTGPDSCRCCPAPAPGRPGIHTGPVRTPPLFLRGPAPWGTTRSPHDRCPHGTTAPAPSETAAARHSATGPSQRGTPQCTGADTHPARRQTGRPGTVPGWFRPGSNSCCTAPHPAHPSAHRPARPETPAAPGRRCPQRRAMRPPPPGWPGCARRTGRRFPGAAPAPAGRPWRIPRRPPRCRRWSHRLPEALHRKSRPGRFGSASRPGRGADRPLRYTPE